MDKKAYFINYCRLKAIAPSTGEWHLVYHNGFNSSSSTSTQTFNRDTIPAGVGQIQIRFPWELGSGETMTVDNREKPLTFNGTYYVTADGSTTILQIDDRYTTYYIENVTATNFRVRRVSKNSYTYGTYFPTCDIEVFYVEPQWHTLWEGSDTLNSTYGIITFTQPVPDNITTMCVNITYDRYVLTGSISIKEDNRYPTVLQKSANGWFITTTTQTGNILNLTRTRSGETTATILFSRLTNADIRWDVSNTNARQAIKVTKIEAFY